ncbi:helix-turn-helix domain-containing protein [Neorhizobium sp. T25_27]|uniref:helix-turn-helix domain-containing protein n=1 Tax=Neorhizobium sp. T25_27 TaxID=2093831 RepID=UPI00155EB005|nr:helix-turn-helix domain-containing protein [Neorhizobium sp. T25_27]
MTVQYPKPTPYQAQLLQAHKLRQSRLASAVRRAGSAQTHRIESNSRPPLWKRSTISFDAHVRAYQFHLANKLVRPEVTYIKKRCAELGVPYRDIVGRSALKSVVAARRLLMWEVRQKFYLAYADVGRAFGGRDQSTAISAIRSFGGGDPLPQ